MKIITIILTACAALALGTAASAQQAMTGTVTRIDRTEGTIAIQATQTQSGTVGANNGGAGDEFKAKVAGGLLETLHAGHRVKFSLTEAGGARTITNVERQ